MGLAGPALARRGRGSLLFGPTVRPPLKSVVLTGVALKWQFGFFLANTQWSHFASALQALARALVGGVLLVVCAVWLTGVVDEQRAVTVVRCGRNQEEVRRYYECSEPHLCVALHKDSKETSCKLERCHYRRVQGFCIYCRYIANTGRAPSITR